MRAIRYSLARHKIRTGDLILFKGEGLLSRLIMTFTGPRSHIGIVVRSESPDMVLLLESTTLSKAKDVELGSVVRGVQLVNLSERLRSYDGELYWRPIAPEFQNGLVETLMEFRREFAGVPYEEHKLDLVKTLVTQVQGVEDLSSFFCSELVAEAYQRLGFLPETDQGGRPSDKYTPIDFSSVAERPIRLIGQYDLGEEVRLTLD